MRIQFNTDKNIRGNDVLRKPLIALITEELSRFSTYITRMEVHLSDEDGNKNGLNDKRCMLEARLKGRQPIAVTNNAENHEQAVSGAVEMLKTSLDKIIERLRDH